MLALSTLGLNASALGDTLTARQLFGQAQKLSRRDFRTQLWTIEDTVARGDIARALYQYDVTLRVYPALGELLYPILATASGETAIRLELVKTLAGRPLWGESFIGYAAGHGPDPRTTAALFLDLRRAGVAVPEAARAGAINALIAAGRIAAAWRYHAVDRPGADWRRSRDPRFTAGTTAPSQLDWMPVDDGGVTASISQGAFDFSAPASIGGPLLRQLQLLPPGNYRLIGHSDGIDQRADTRPYWTLICGDGRELGRVPVPNSIAANGNFVGMFTVPTGCPTQTLVLVAQASDAVAGLSGRIDRVELMPAS